MVQSTAPTVAQYLASLPTERRTVVAKSIARVPMAKYVQIYQASKHR